MASLIPELIEIDLDQVKTTTQAKFLPAPLFDYEKGDFVRDATGRIKFCDGREAWKQWCFKVAATERDTCIAYSTAIGVEAENAGAQGTDSAIMSALERTITEALMVHPMTASVRSFELEDDKNGEKTVTFEVTGVNAAGFTTSMSFKV